ncbi:MAG: 30S ribosomal protein S1 [Deltaproteobacteria bacterium]|nr:30S ribosomal protein S1 [Deltaproteobacteria bacterium]MBW2594799.1 30S ribosomal protein S1 [Deltaproteobacteria bacterium]MBW2650136.1 30S ribosomal protein S1 [Deltaproteobacteria bacterium]
MVNEDNLITEPEKKEVEVEVEDVAEVGLQKEEEDITFVELYEQNLQDVAIGKVVMGKIVQINDDAAMVDVGYKTEGVLYLSEVTDSEGNITISVGDEIEVLVDRRKDAELILSKEKAASMKIWDDVIKISEENGTIQGTIVQRVKGGLSVDIGFPAFLPGSQVSTHPVKDLDRYVGQTMDFQILKYDRKRNNVVLSRKAILEIEREEKKKKTLETLEEDKIIEGVVKNITDYGMFIDLGGIDGLLHITDMSWGRIRHPSETFSREDKITVKVLSFDREKERVSLGLKQLTENPWDVIVEKYPVESIIEGKVVSLMDYGAFVEIEPGVEGLVHVSEMFWTKKIRHPSKILSVDDTVKIMVLDVNPENKRISLGLKQTMPNPWIELKERYPEGTVIKGEIKNVTDFGIFVGIEDDIDGLIHVSDISWKKRIKHPSEFYKKGQEIEAVILGIDVDAEKFSLGIKQLEENPWEKLASRYVPGSIITGKVTNITDFGVFVEIEDGIEGLVHISEISHERIKSARDIYSVGDVVSAVVKNVDIVSQKIGLSIKDSEKASDDTSKKQYINNNEKVVSNLGDMLAGIKV